MSDSLESNATTATRRHSLHKNFTPGNNPNSGGEISPRVNNKQSDSNQNNNNNDNNEESKSNGSKKEEYKRRQSSSHVVGKVLNQEEEQNLDLDMKRAAISHHTSSSDMGNFSRKSEIKSKKPPPSPGISRGIVTGENVSGRKSNDGIDGSNVETFNNIQLSPSKNGSMAKPKISEVVKSAGLVFSEKGEHQFIMTKPKIMAIKSRDVAKFERQMEEFIGVEVEGR